MLNPLALDAVCRIRHEYSRSTVPWFLGFSGGKDSSTVLKLTFIALRAIRSPTKPIRVIYCDTGVEIPIVREFVLDTFRRLRREVRKSRLPLSFSVVAPRLVDRYFVKVIGRGYPPPTNKFRWCTDVLRILPVQRVLRNQVSERGLVLLGVRQGESAERDRTLRRHQNNEEGYFKQVGNRQTIIYSPIVNFGVEDVWETLLSDEPPISLDTSGLATLYKQASGECPIIRDPQGSPCGKGRFGCWTCTVVRKDKAVANLIRVDGYEELTPLLEFRNWLISIRDEPAYRCRQRRNGVSGLGPFTLKARSEILRKLLSAERHTAWQLISEDEISEIRALWRKDRNSLSYLE